MEKKRFEQYRTASGLATADVTQQVSTLLYCIGEEAESVLASTNTRDEERKSYTAVVDKFDAFFKVRRNVIYERTRFNCRSQQQDEMAKQYIMELYPLADNCDYGALRHEKIRDRLVVGIHVRDMALALSQQLQLDAELTLQKAKTKVRQREAVGEQQRELKGDPTSLAAIGARRHTRGKRPTGPPQRSSNPKGRTKKCMRCGNEPHPREKCPAKDATCH